MKYEILPTKIWQAVGFLQEDQLCTTIAEITPTVAENCGVAPKREKSLDY